MRYVLVLVGIVLLQACNDKGASDQSTTTTDTSSTAPKPEDGPDEQVTLSKVTAVALGDSGACALDDQNRAACWVHLTKFVPSSPGSSKGSTEIAYPKKTNSDLASDTFSAISGNGKFFCGVTTKGKVNCFTPDGVSTIARTNLASLGSIKKVASNEKGQICVIDLQNKLTCHALDLSSSVAADDFVSTTEIAELTSGIILYPEKRFSAFGCWTTTANTLQCELFFDGGEAAAAQELASQIAPGVGVFQSIAIVLPDRKTVKYFGVNRKLAVDATEEFSTAGTFESIFAQFHTFCGIAPTTNVLTCRVSKKPIDALAKTNEALASETFSKITVGSMFVCGLKGDKTIDCWQFKNYQWGVPKNIAAE